MLRSLCSAIFVAAGTLSAAGQSGGSGSGLTPEVLKDLAPTGKLRAAINLGNPVLAQGTAEAPGGVTVDLARELARRAGLPLEFVIFKSAGKVFESAGGGTWDVAFIAFEPVRARQLEFTPPYVLIEGTYMVLKGSPLQAVGDV